MSTLDHTPGEISSPGNAPAQSEPPVSTPPAPPPGPPLDRIEPLNLARRPFLNSRPVVRVSLLLWLLGFALLMWNVVQFQRYLSESADKRAQIERGRREVARQQETAAALQARLDALDLEQLNEQVEFLNEKIEERTFSWSLLLDRLAEVLPNDVRLVRLAPQTDARVRRERERARAAGQEGPEQRIFLAISGETRDNEALLQFVDNLFAHPAFAEPNLTRDERIDEAGTLVRFDLTLQYIPGGTPQGVVIEEVPATPAIKEIPAPGTGAPGPAAPGGGRP